MAWITLIVFSLTPLLLQKQEIPVMRLSIEVHSKSTDVPLSFEVKIGKWRIYNVYFGLSVKSLCRAYKAFCVQSKTFY
jgi:hypothetical protein